jgi:hypothetical protein
VNLNLNATVDVVVDRAFALVPGIDGPRVAPNRRLRLEAGRVNVNDEGGVHVQVHVNVNVGVAI